MDGFKPRNPTIWNSQEWWSSGCVRHSPLNCSSINGSSESTATEGFLQVTDKSLSDAEAVEYAQESLSLQGCKNACLNNCSCTAFSFSGSDCKLWFGDLLGMQANSSSFEGQPFFIRLADSDVKQLSARGGRRSSRGRVVALYLAIPLGVSFFSSLSICAWFIYNRRRRLLQEYDTSKSLTTFTYKELKIASNNFSHKLGKGAFGSVFKATLPDNTLVAVKKLEGSVQAEISTIGNIHHVNLVRLRGFCVEGSHRMLVYEYMQNGSLNTFLSRKSKEEDKVLDCKTRFGIILGTARGLLYLHEECRDHIIHCDIYHSLPYKARKHSSRCRFFSKSCRSWAGKACWQRFQQGVDDNKRNERVFGFRVALRVANNSFGMTLLEIISGRRNSDLSVQDSQHYFPTWAAAQINKGNTTGLVDERIADKVDIEEVRRAAVVSFLCIQMDENERPSMAEVVRILEGKSQGGVDQYERSLQAFVNDHCD